LALSDTARVWLLRPAADVLFASVAPVFTTRVIAVVLTGGGSDGTHGIQVVKQWGGTVIAQDEASSEVFQMPRSAIATGAVDAVLSLEQIGPALMACSRHTAGAFPACPADYSLVRATLPQIRHNSEKLPSPDDHFPLYSPRLVFPKEARAICVCVWHTPSPIEPSHRLPSLEGQAHEMVMRNEREYAGVMLSGRFRAHSQRC
jgi:hypothetical protein